MATKTLGLGTVTSVDHDADTNFTTVTLTTSITPPARKRERIDGTTLSDTLATYEPGIEQHSEYSFTQCWEPGDTTHEIVDTLFGAKTKVVWHIVYTTDPATTDSFTGWVSDLEPETIEVNNLLMRQITIQRTTAITRS